MTKYSKLIGMVLTMIGGLCYATGGAAGQYLFLHNNMTSNWLVPIRLLSAGILLLAIAKFLGAFILAPFKKKRDIFEMLIFAFVGSLFSQYGYYTSIEYSNVAFATILAYATPLFIIVYLVCKNRKLPTLYEALSVVFVTVGIFFMCTHGDLSDLAIDPKALFWGLVGAGAYAVYTVQPARLLTKFNLFAVIGWGFVISGLSLMFVFKPWTNTDLVYDSYLYLMMSIVIFVGTVLAFTTYLAGVRIVGGLAASVLSSVEPLASFAICVLFLGISLTWHDFAGMMLVILAIMLIAKNKEK